MVRFYTYPYPYKMSMVYVGPPTEREKKQEEKQQSPMRFQIHSENVEMKGMCRNAQSFLGDWFRFWI